MSKYTQLLSEEVREKIEQYIDKNHILAHQMLPAERTFAEILDVKRLTLRKALQQMKDEGIVSAYHGKGNFLNPKKFLEDAKSFISYSAGWQSDGYTVQSKVISMTLLEANIKVSSNLGLNLGAPVYELKRIRYLDGTALFLETAYISAERCPELNKFDFEKNSLYKILEEQYGIKLVKQTHNISITTLTRQETEYLEAPEGTAAFYIKGVTCDAENNPAEYCISLNRADLYAITSKIASNVSVKQERVGQK